MVEPPRPVENKPDPVLPVEVEVYINPDGTVTFADLEAELLPLARRLNPDQVVTDDISQPEEQRGSDLVEENWPMTEVERLLRTALQIIRDRVAVFWLQREVNRLKILNYDLLLDNVHGLRRALDTQRRALDDLHRQLADRDAQVKKLQSEYAALQLLHSQAGATSAQAERLNLFKRLQAIAVQLPTLRAAVDEGADITARDVLDLLAPLDEVLHDFGFEPIGEAGAQAHYDPTRHRPVGRGSRSVTPDDMVRIRYVGYLYQGQVVCKAEVVRIEQPEPVG